jgi:dihydroxynaphthoic acid synthetase
MANNDDELLVDFKDHVLTLTINRPERRNALSPTARFKLNSELIKASKDRRIGAIVITGAGDKAFCSGGDVNFERGAVPEGQAGDVHGTVEAMRLCQVPIVAAVKGYAVGSGNWLAYLCDLTVAADNAVFAQNGARIGSGAAGYFVAYLTRVVGEKKAREMWYLCRRYTAQEALAMGLINEVFPLAEFDDRLGEYCKELVQRSPTTIKLLKTTFDRALDDLRSLRADYWQSMVAPEFGVNGELHEGVTAFKEKREPDFTPWRLEVPPTTKV